MVRRYQEFDENFKSGAVWLLFKIGKPMRRWPGTWGQRGHAGQLGCRNATAAGRRLGPLSKDGLAWLRPGTSSCGCSVMCGRARRPSRWTRRSAGSGGRCPALRRHPRESRPRQIHYGSRGFTAISKSIISPQPFRIRKVRAVSGPKLRFPSDEWRVAGSSRGHRLHLSRCSPRLPLVRGEETDNEAACTAELKAGAFDEERDIKGVPAGRQLPGSTPNDAPMPPMRSPSP